MSAFALMAFVANATEPVGSVVTTSCGKRLMTVSSNDGFLNKEDYYDYMRDLNEVECGTREMPKEIADRF